MSAPLRILAIPGSLRRDSHNRALVAAAVELAPDGVVVEVWDGLAGLPHYDEDIEADGGPGTPAPVAELRGRIAAADAVLISTPEYNSSIPGSLKNALDWASRPYGAAEIVGKHAAVVGASPSSFGAAWAQAEVRKVLAASGARVLEQGLSLSKAHAKRGDDGRLADEETRAELAALLVRLAEAVRAPAEDESPAPA
jgi:chromate reductase